MQLFLHIAFILVPLQVIGHVVVAFLYFNGPCTITLLRLAMVSTGTHFIHVATLRYGGRQWWHGSLFCLAVHIGLAPLVPSEAQAHWHALVIPNLLNTLTMLVRRPHWERAMDDT